MTNPVLISESFERAAYAHKHSLDSFTNRFEESVRTFERSVDRLAKILGMQAENDQRKAVGASMAYTEEDFASVYDRIKGPPMNTKIPPHPLR